VSIQNEGGNAIADAALGAARTDMGFLHVHADPTWAGERAGSSANWDMIANAAALWWDTPHRAQWVKAWHDLFASERTAFQRSEARSPIYSGWHLLSVLLVYRWAVQHGDVILRAAARAWLENFWSMMALVAARTRSGKPVLALAGMRGTEFTLDADWSHRNAWREALGDEGWPHRGEYDPEQVNSWCDASVAALSQEIRFTAADAVYAYRTGTEQAWRDLIAAAPKFGARGVGHILRTTGGVVCWNDADINGNTAALMAFKVEGGDLASLPPNGGERLRANSHAVIAEIGDALHYTSPLLGVHSMPLPPGELVYRVRIAEDGWRVTWPEPVPAPAPPEPPTPAPPVPPPPGGPGRGDSGGRDRRRVAVGAGLLALIASLLARWAERREKP
jgi:hypothetical protein